MPDLQQHYDFEDGGVLLRAAGSFWAEVFGDRKRLSKEYEALGQIYLQARLNYDEALAALSRFKIPIYHRTRWFALIIKDSDILPEEALLKYGLDAVYGPQPDGRVYLYGTAIRNVYAYSLGDYKLADVPGHVANRILDPSLVLTKGVDYTIDRDLNAIVFTTDPFANELIAKRPVYEDNVMVGQEIILWVFNGDFDENLVHDHFGYVLGISARSSEYYKKLVNAVFNALVRTPTMEDVRLLLTAVTGVPVVETDGEVVEYIQTTGGYLQIITDKAVYRFNEAATPIVAVGDVLRGGQELVDVVEVIELSGQSYDLSSIPALALDEEFMSDGFQSFIVFNNETVPLEYIGIDGDGKAEVRFAAGGYPADVTRFWRNVHERGKAYALAVAEDAPAEEKAAALALNPTGKTLAEMLDTRINPPTDPTLPPSMLQPQPQDLPQTVNPLEFMVANLFRNNMFILKLKPTKFDPTAVGLQYMYLLRRILPPQITFLVFIETPAAEDTMDLELPEVAIDLDPLAFDSPGQQLDEVGVSIAYDCWVEDAMVRPRYVEEV